jgi:hypothetical protein
MTIKFPRDQKPETRNQKPERIQSASLSEDQKADGHRILIIPAKAGI